MVYGYTTLLRIYLTNWAGSTPTLESKTLGTVNMRRCAHPICHLPAY